MSGSSVIFFGLHRGGSSISARLLQIMLRAVNYELVDHGKTYYDAGYASNDIPLELFRSMQCKGQFYGPFRDFPSAMRMMDLAQFTKIAVVRDPRDIIVSMYFAWRGVHDSADRQLMRSVLPTQRDADEEINEFCYRIAPAVKEMMSSLKALCELYPDTLVFRYEDIFNEPVKWVGSVARNLGLDVPEASYDQIRLESEMVPEVEDVTRHNRQGSPGDHNRKLARSTCIYLTKIFADDLRFFDYTGDRSFFRQNGVTVSSIGFGEAMESKSHLEEISALKRLIVELQRENGFRIEELARLRDLINTSADS